MLNRIITLKDINKVAISLIKIANIQKKNKKAFILALSGELGVGKTTITQAIAKNLEIKENLVSPTFVIMKKYEIKKGIFKKLIHIDAYRLEKEEDLINLGWSELIKDEGNLIIVEWPERVLTHINKKNAHFVYLDHINEKKRSLIV